MVLGAATSGQCVKDSGNVWSALRKGSHDLGKIGLGGLCFCGTSATRRLTVPSD